MAMNEREIFETALEISDPKARLAFLDKACRGDSDLRAKVESLLKSHENAGSFLDVPAMDQMGRPGSDRTAQTIVGSPAAGDDDSDDGQADLSFLNPPAKPGSIGRLGHYEILKVLGQGAFGIVFKAFDEKLHRHVAIKAMNPQLASTSPPRKRFLREARSVAALKHENVVQIYSVEEEPLPYLAMEFVDGGTLADKLNTAGPLDVSEILYIGRQMAAGLAAAHEKGLIHRDIKPGNILIEDGAEQKVKITDFGLARAADDATMTRTGTIAGTPMYMAPEQAMGQTLDHRADLFSLGSVMYQMACGRPPFRGASAIAVLKRVVDEDARPIQDILPEVPEWLCTIIAKLHAKNPDDRFQTAKEVADLLGRCQAELQTSGQVTCVQSRHLAPRDEPSPAAPSINNRPSTNQSTSQPGGTQPSGTVQGSSRRSETATFKRPLLFFTGILATAAIITAIVINRGKDTTNAPITEISNQKSKIENPSWHGWPADAPKPAIAPFNADEARQHQDAWAKYLNVPVEYTNSIGMKFRLIPPGEFTMGSTAEEIDALLSVRDERFSPTQAENWKVAIRTEAPQQPTILTKPFYMAIHEVTQAAYENVTGQNPSQLSRLGEGVPTGQHPVENVDWNECVVFCSKLSVREKFPPHYYWAGDVVTPLPGAGYRLPTEAEWEFTSRGGTTNSRWVGDKDSDAVKAAWFDANSGGRTHAVGELLPNPFGMYDILGNVSEFCEDGSNIATGSSRYTAMPAVNPRTSWIGQGTRVLRGGEFEFESACSRSAFRNNLYPNARGVAGFRIALEVDAVRQALKLTGPAIPKSQAMELSNNDPTSQISKLKSEIPTAPGWHGWPADAPPPAIAPFNAEQAIQHQEAWAKYLNVPVDYTNSIGMKFRLIPPGEFLMGSTPEEIDVALKHVDPSYKEWQDCIKSEAPQHKVILTQPIYLGVNEVTQAEYKKVMGTNPSKFAPMGEGKDMVVGRDTSGHPVEMVSWSDAAEFCAKVSQAERFKPFYFRSGDTITPLINGTGYRLPTEAEWECACRAGTTTKYWSGDRDQDLARVGWFAPNSGGRTHAVGELTANPFGLADIHGNVWEWVQDSLDATWYGQFETKPAIDPDSPFAAASQRVYRGGDWLLGAYLCRSAFRKAAGDNLTVGFRVSLMVDAVRQALKVTGPAMPRSVASDTVAANASEELPATFTNSLGMEFVKVPKGTGWLGGGGGKPGEQKVEFTDDFYLGKYEVTQEEWAKVTGLKPSRFQHDDAVKDIPDADLKRFPVEMVSWDDCQLVIERLNKKDKDTGWVYRLPTKAEWEYACRGGPVDKLDSAFDFYLATPTNELRPDQANFAPEPGKGLQRTWKVGSSQPNTLGLFEMHGNVWEWCDDPIIDPSGTKFRVTRGGGWSTHHRDCGAAPTGGSDPSLKSGALGLRLARVRVSEKSVTDPDRALAEWVLTFPQPSAVGVIVGDRGIDVGNAAALPQERFQVVSIYVNVPSGRSVTDGDFERFRDVTKLQSIIVGCNSAVSPISNLALETLSKSASADSIWRLSLIHGSHSIDDGAIPHLNRLKNLKLLSLWAPKLTDEGLAQLNVPEIISLELEGLGASGRPLTLHGLKPGKLTVLHLLNSGVTDEAAPFIAGIHGLQALNLQDNRSFSDVGARQLLTSLQSLNALSLATTSVSDDICAEIAMHPKLTTLNLTGSRISDRGVESLSASPHLTHLSLDGSPITDAGLVFLIKLRTLEQLTVLGCKNVTEPAVRKLQAALPKCKIQSDFPNITAMTTPAGDPIDFNAERKAAERLLQLDKGYVALMDDKGNLVELKESLPPENFFVHTAQFPNADLTDEELGALVECRGLVELSLYQNPKLTPAGLKAIGPLPRLKGLNLEATQCARDGLDFIANYPALESLQLLVSESVPDSAMRTLPPCPNLKVLSTTHNVGEEGLAHIATQCPSLESLYLNDHTVSSIEPLAPLQKLQHLLCAGAQLTDAGIAVVAKLPDFQRLWIDSPDSAVWTRLVPLMDGLRDIHLREQFPKTANESIAVLPVTDFKRMESVTIVDWIVVDANALKRIGALPQLKSLVIQDSIPPDQRPAFRKYTTDDVEAFRRQRPDVHFNIDGKYYPATK